MTGVRGTPSRRLAAKLGLVMPGLLAETRRMWGHPEPGELYREWLRALHGMIRATVPLILDATTTCLARDDDLSRAVAAYLARHAHEEYGHDQDVLADYARAGGDPATLLADPPPPCVAAVVGAQYYWIRHAHPVALLGHIAVLEGHPPPPGLAPFLSRRTGLPLDAFRTLATHAVLDDGHREELWQAIDRLPLTPEAETLIGLSALNTAHGLAQLVEAVQLRVNAARKETTWRPSTNWKPRAST
ncbi:iron-containing redox enzyme family protein [Nonomuraea sp. MG754425]|uniref:iron-containing redox enzyme family protein n=1 Tax=Nonomuraea sp. MG754425 TaxID=2570319 RepID=UPI001F2F4AFE|nr:iron-containing redox enzyme family protein [Nonomuraea sp. MG754425]MCF6470231.1 iron-containing redox enzyme family protein [Nonomuraea sp. MG754425]